MGLYEQLQKADIKPGAQIIKTEKIPGRMLPQKILSAFGLEKSDEFIRIVRLRTANDRKIAIENSHFRLVFFQIP
jgi:DNA-binding GntR family transcriptional regulator